MKKIYQVLGKGNIGHIVSSLFLNLTKERGGVYSSGKDTCSFHCCVLDASARYSQNHQRLEITGEDWEDWKRLLEPKLNSRKLKLRESKCR